MLNTKYTEVEYLEADGTQYINTGYIPKQNTYVELNAMYTALDSTYRTPFSVRTSDGAANSFTIAGSTNLANVYAFGSQYWSGDSGCPVASTNVKYFMSLKSGEANFNGVTHTAGTTITPSSLTAYMFARNANGTAANFFKGRIYYCKIFENGVLLHSFIPCLDSNNVPCMWDKVENKAYYNLGTGSFTYGHKIIPVEYLESTGTQYIDTGYKMSNDNMTFDGNIMWTDKNATANFFFGYRLVNSPVVTGDMRAFFVYGASASPIGRLAIRYGVNADNSTQAISLNTKYNISWDGSNLKINGTTYDTLTQAYTPASYKSMFLFWCNCENTYSADVGKFVGRIYNWQIKQDGVLVRDFIPCKDENNVGYMFDRVTHSLYANAGTGAFVVGNELKSTHNKKMLRRQLALMLARLKKKRPYYCEVEYLEGSGTQYINTGMLSTADSKVDVVFGFTTMESGAANNCAVFGGRTNTTTNTFTFFKLATGNPQYFRFDYNGQQTIGTASNLTWDTTSKYRFTYDGSTMMSQNITTGESSSVTKAPSGTFTTSPITLFAVNTSNQAGQFMSGRIYKFWYTDGTTTIDLIPVLDWDMTPCMYDKVSGQFFYNAGTGDFTAGREIHYVEYLENESGQASVNYIPTKYTPTTNTGIEAKVRYNGGASGATWAMGAATWWGIHYQGSGPKIGITNSSTDQYQVYAPYTAGNDITLKLDGSNVYADGTLVGSLTKQNASSTLTLFRYSTSANLSWVGRIYYLDIWDNNGDVFKFRPAIDETGKGYLFDQISHTIFDNAGSGNFAYPAREVEYLESDGARAIIAGVTVDDTSGYDVKWMALNANDTIILGTKGSGDSRWVLSGSNNPYVNISWNTSSGGTGLGLNKIQTAQMNYFNDRKRILNDTPFTDITQTLSANASTYSVGIFGGYWGASQISLYSTCRIYYAKISKGTGLVRDFVPMFKDGSPCLFDKIGGLYYFGTGTGSFTTGKIVEPEYE